MGEGQFGGDGSVKWVVTTEQPFGGPGGPRTDGGIDGKFGQEFVVRLMLPDGVSLDDFRRNAEMDGQYVVFRLPIKKVAKQIHIQWGPQGTTAV
jgi:hypothetical protein